MSASKKQKICEDILLTFENEIIGLYASPNKIDQDLFCGICKEPYKDPRVLFCGHIFCRSCFTDIDKCPCCKASIQKTIKRMDKFPPVIHFRDKCDSLMIKCSSEGCPFESERRSMIDHSKVCKQRHIPCEMKRYGCDWNGLFEGLKDHKKECVFSKLKPFIEKTEERMIQMKHQLNQHDERIYSRPEFDENGRSSQSTGQVREEI